MNFLKTKDLKYKGKSEEELKAMGMNEFAKLTNSRIRRTLGRGLSEVHKKLLEKIEKYSTKSKKPIKTHCRNMPIIPKMIGTQIHIYNGKKYIPVDITIEMLGHYLGEFTQTRNKVSHKAPGVGATRSSKHVSVK